MKKKCADCGLFDSYGTSSKCYGCLQTSIKTKNQAKKICTRCFEPKEQNGSSYCNSCRTNINNKAKYRDMEADFKIDLYQFLKQLNPDKIDAIECFMIAHYWSEIILFPHLYYNLDTYDQIENMIDDLNEFLMGKRIQKQVRKKI